MSKKLKELEEENKQLKDKLEKQKIKYNMLLNDIIYTLEQAYNFQEKLGEREKNNDILSKRINTSLQSCSEIKFNKKNKRNKK